MLEPVKISSRDLELKKDYFKNTATQCNTCNVILPKSFRGGAEICSLCKSVKAKEMRVRERKAEKEKAEQYFGKVRK